MNGPHQFKYGQQTQYCIALVHRPLGHHQLSRNGRVVREGRVQAERFRLSLPGEVIEAEVTTPDVIDMTHIYFSQDSLLNLLDELELHKVPHQLTDPCWDWSNAEFHLASRLIRLSLNEDIQTDWTRLELLGMYLMSAILRERHQEMRYQRLQVRSSPRINRAIEFIQDNLSQPIRLSDIAEAACLSKFHLCRIFKEVVGISPHEYLQERRLAEARLLLLQTSYRLDEIAFRTGFASAGSMAGAIRRRFGVGPKNLRRGL